MKVKIKKSQLASIIRQVQEQSLVSRMKKKFGRNVEGFKKWVQKHKQELKNVADALVLDSKQMNEQRVINRPAPMIKLQFMDDAEFNKAKRVIKNDIDKLGSPQFNHTVVDAEKYITVPNGKQFATFKRYLQKNGIKNYKVNSVK